MLPWLYCSDQGRKRKERLDEDCVVGWLSRDGPGFSMGAGRSFDGGETVAGAGNDVSGTAPETGAVALRREDLCVAGRRVSYRWLYGHGSYRQIYRWRAGLRCGGNPEERPWTDAVDSNRYGGAAGRRKDGLALCEHGQDEERGWAGGIGDACLRT